MKLTVLVTECFWYICITLLGQYGELGYGMPGYPGMFAPPGYNPMVPPIPGMPYGFTSPEQYPMHSASNQQLSPANTISEKDFQQMILKHKKRRNRNEVMTELKLHDPFCGILLQWKIQDFSNYIFSFLESKLISKTIFYLHTFLTKYQGNATSQLYLFGL